MSIFSQPFPRENSIRRSILNAFVSGVVVMVFLRVFSPFGFGSAPVKDLNLFAAGYGIVTTIVLLIITAFEKIFPIWFAEDKWTVGKNILLYLIIIFFIGTANFLYTAFAAQMPLDFYRFLNFLLFTLSVTFVVTSFLTMLKYFRSLKYYKAEALIAEKEVSQLKPVNQESVVNFKSENAKEDLMVPVNDLLYIEAADNYSKIVYKSNGKITSTLLRSSLKKLEDQITAPELWRCHRTFIVQLRNVDKVSGNSQGYRLHLKESVESIPVSRRFGDEIHKRLNELR